MAQERTQRRLAAILAADVAGYGRLMEQDETATLTSLKQRRQEILQPLVAEHHGRIVKVMGDGVLVEFGSAVNAVACAVELQKRMEAANDRLAADRRISLRIGINLGDVVVEGGDLYGDGVVIAVRLQAMPAPGGICISGSVHEQVGNKMPLAFEDAGLCEVKNIAKPVRVYRIGPLRPDSAETRSLLLPSKPSIAILPFTNISADADQEFFVDGLTEDLITEVSKVPGLFVIARHSSFAFKNKSIDVRRVAQELGVRYILEGSARRVTGRIRINAQLIDAREGGGHLWAERFDRDLADVFAVQDEVTSKIVEALVGRLKAEGIPERRKPTNLEAYDLFLRGRALLLQSPQAVAETRLMFERAIALDPEFAEAHRWLALSLSTAWMYYGHAKEPNNRLAFEAVQKALALDPSDGGTRGTHAILLKHDSRWSEAEAEFAVALKLDPNNADTWAELSELRMSSGRPTEALAHIQKALRLNPYPPGWYYWALGQAQYLDRQYEQAVITLCREETYRTSSRRTLAASLAQLGKLDEARREAEMFMVSNPHFTIRQWIELIPFRDEAARQHFVDGYRKAGLPE